MLTVLGIDAGGMLPVTVVISRRPAPGHEQDLTDWARGVREVAERFPGHLDAQIYPPQVPDHPDLVIAFSFESAEALSAWEHSEERRRWLALSEQWVQGEATTHAVSGFEGIFAHAPGAPVVPPPRWKTATIIALALYPVSLLLTLLLAPLTADWNLLLRVLLNVAIIVPYMAWIGVPYLSRWLGSWLRS